MSVASKHLADVLENLTDDDLMNATNIPEPLRHLEGLVRKKQKFKTGGAELEAIGHGDGHSNRADRFKTEFYKWPTANRLDRRFQEVRMCDDYTSVLWL